MLAFFDCLDKGRRNWNALRPRGPSLFRSAGKGSKRGRFARHFGSGKMEPRTNPFGEPSQTQPLTRLQTHGKVRFALRAKIPSRATQSDSAGAASASRKLLNAPLAAGDARFLHPFVTWKAIAPQSGNDRPRQRCAKLGAWLVREFSRAAGKRKGFLSEPP